MKAKKELHDFAWAWQKMKEGRIYCIRIDKAVSIGDKWQWQWHCGCCQMNEDLEGKDWQAYDLHRRMQ